MITVMFIALSLTFIVLAVCWLHNEPRAGEGPEPDRDSDFRPSVARPSHQANTRRPPVESTCTGLLPLELSTTPGAVEPLRAVLWPQTRLVQSARQGNSMVLDCLVPREGDRGSRHPAALPFAMRVHAVAGLTPADEAESVLRRWVDSDALIDVGIGRDGFRTLLTLQGDGNRIVVELERVR